MLLLLLSLNKRCLFGSLCCKVLQICDAGRIAVAGVALNCRIAVVVIHVVSKLFLLRMRLRVRVLLVVIEMKNRLFNFSRSSRIQTF